MSTHPVPAPTAAGSTVVPVARLVEAGLRRVDAAIFVASAVDATEPLARAARARRLAELHGRRARWWTVLRRATMADRVVPLVYVMAVVDAAGAAKDQARFWSEAAADWQARADRRPTSDAAGAMSNWADLGVTEPPAVGLPDTTAAVAR